jgi:exosome complex RNA-binding protein Rrp42 (RNase PH superfamily)
MEQDTKGAYKARLVDGVPESKPLQLQSVPLSLTMGVYEGHLVCDLTSFEEGRMGSILTIIVDRDGTLQGTCQFCPKSGSPISLNIRSEARRRGSSCLKVHS